MMRTVLHLSFALLFLSFFTSPALAGEIRVEIIGPDELTSLAPGIKHSITARCIAKGVNLEDYPELAVTILKMGDAISYDAVLETEPPRGFHSDIKDLSGITVAIDEMITKIFIETPVVRQKPPEIPAEPSTATQTREDIKLPFIATSVVVHDETMYVSDAQTLYILKDAQPKPQWNSPGKDKIFRLYSYKDSILALVKRGDIFNTYQIRDGKTLQHWNKAVIPIAGSLVSSQIMSDTDVPDSINSWTKPVFIDGDAYLLPADIDIPTMIIGDVMPSIEGNEFITINKRGYLAVQNNGKTIWSSETKINSLPLFVEQDIYVDDPPERYYMMPRILVRNGEFITINNDRGMSKIFGNIILYTGADILAFSPEKSDFEDHVLAHIRKYYCADIALRDTTLIALVIKKKESYVRVLDL